MAFPQSPVIKFEDLPDESFLSAPGDSFPSLFAASTPSPSSPSPTATTMHPIEMMTPQSFTDEKQDPSRLSVVPEASEEGSPESAAVAADKKPTKKRKSWGQVLPEPKTNLPPRKRAKTEDEKEQRRVERVLRNRRAAQSSRERKRLEVEALEKRNKELEQLLINVQKTNLMLLEELNRVQRPSGVVTRSSSPLESLRESITLSQQLFSSEDGQEMDDMMRSGVSPSANPPTVNPASLSPPLNPVPDCDEAQELDDEVEEDEDEVEDETMNDEVPLAAPKTPEPRASEVIPAVSSDSTQRPAEMLCDLQCQSAEMPQSFLASQTSILPLFTFYMQLRMLLFSVPMILSFCQRPLAQIAISSKAGFSLLPTPQLLTTIIWLVTIPPASRIIPTSTSSTSTTSSPTTQATQPMTLWQRATSPLRTAEATSKSTTLRLKSLRSILTSSPSLARPLMDATLIALRLVSERCDDRVDDAELASSEMHGDVDELTTCLSSIALPSREVLMALVWALKVEERRILRKQSAGVGTERNTSDSRLSKLNKGAGEARGERVKAV